jgi:hypothetical protein
MRRPRIIIAGTGLAAIASVGGVTAAAATGSPASGTTPTASASAPASAFAAGPGATATVHTVLAMVGGRTETILVNAHRLPLFVATAGLTPAAKSSAPGTSVPAAPSGGYGY